jgi:hypothetical protein
MSNRERSGWRDLYISAFHRVRFDDDSSAFDLDLVGLCGRCVGHLYVIESTRQRVGKPTAWTERTAMRLNVPGLLVAYAVHDDWPPDMVRTKTSRELVENIAAIEATRVYPDRTKIGGELDLVLYLKELRAAHKILWHERARQLP